MYVRGGHGYYRGSEQRAMRGWFLILLQPNKGSISESCSPDNTYAIVRRVALGQFGHFMMGNANINGKWVTISGAYGNDGLPRDIDSLPKDAVKLPRELYDAWAKGEGWNGAGNEAQAMREWAIKTFPIVNKKDSRYGR